MTTCDLDTLLTNVEEMEDVTGDYFPTVEELTACDERDLEDNLIPLLAYFASDPFKKLEKYSLVSPEYNETVSFCKRFLYNIHLEDA